MWQALSERRLRVNRSWVESRSADRLPPLIAAEGSASHTQVIGSPPSSRQLPFLAHFLG